MPVSPSAASELQSSLSKLSIGEKSPIKDLHRPQGTTATTTTKPKSKTPVADSWEDEIDATSEDEDRHPKPGKESTPISPAISTSAEGPLDPPPTPISPPTSAGPEYGSPSTSPLPGRRSRGDSGSGTALGQGPARRPEKQTAVAGRMIAGALGIRAPKRTPEQRAYDRSVKEQEIRRRNREKEQAAKEKEEGEKAKAAIWDE